MGVHRHGQEGALAPSLSSLWKCCERRIIYALLSRPVVGFWGLSSQAPTVAPSLDPSGGLSSQESSGVASYGALGHIPLDF